MYANDYYGFFVFKGPSLSGTSSKSFGSILLGYGGGRAYLPFKEATLGGSTANVSKIFYCPSLTESNWVPAGSDASKFEFYTYGMPAYAYDVTFNQLGQTSTSSFIHKFYNAAGQERGCYYVSSRMKKPTATILMADSGRDNTDAAPGLQTSEITLKYSSPAGKGIMLRHRNRANAAYFDGHAAGGTAYDYRKSACEVKNFVQGDNEFLKIN